MNADYNKTIIVKNNAGQVFDALTLNIPLWWTEMFEGKSNNIGDRFTVRFGDNVHKTIEVTDMLLHKKLEWLVTDSLINIPDLTRKSEWTDTRIIWEMEPQNDETTLSLTHVGLTPSVECYDICVDGWMNFITSLKQYIETGKGRPFLKEQSSH